jgi:hypothetical protein
MLLRPIIAPDGSAFGRPAFTSTDGCCLVPPSADNHPVSRL